MPDLMGLSPEEIRGVGARRTATEAGQRQQLGMVLDLLGQKGRGEYQEAQTALTKAKMEKLMNPKMTAVKINDVDYNIPAENLLEGLRTKTTIEEQLRTGKISQAEHDAQAKPVTIHMQGPEGEMIPVETTVGNLRNVAAGVKDATDARTRIVKERRRTAGLEALGETTLQDIETIPIRDIITAAPEAQAAALSRQVRGKTAGDFTPTELEKIRVNHEINAATIINDEVVSDAAISTYNARSKQLGFPTMMFHYMTTETFPDTDEAVEVKLPVGVTPAKVEEAAAARKMRVEDILKMIYEKQQAER